VAVLNHDADPERHRVFRVLHRPLLLCGIDHRLFWMSLLTGVAVFNVAYSFLLGLGVTVACYLGSWALAQLDPDMLQILKVTRDQKAEYDSGRSDFRKEPPCLD
jgi:type IV secretory pathway TrbD component